MARFGRSFPSRGVWIGKKLAFAGTVTNSIGTASRDYSTIALWEAALPVSAVATNNSYVGQCYNDSEFDLSTTQLVIGGTTTDSTHTITLTTGSGQGFRDNANAATNALRYNAANGVAIKINLSYTAGFVVSDSFVTLQNLQYKNTGPNGNAIGLQVTGTDCVVDSCIIQAVGGAASAFTTAFGGNRGKLTDSLIVSDNSIATAGALLQSDTTLINNTIVKPSNQTTSGIGIQVAYSTTESIKNCAVAGFTTAMGGSGIGSATGSNNAIDGASYPSGITGNVNLVIATEFENPSNGSSVMDWRLKSTSVSCKDQGTNSGTTTIDIVGQPISNIIRDVGAWELQQGGATRGLFFNANLALGAGGSFFSDRLAL